MKITRREFLILTGAFLGGSETAGTSGNAARGDGRVINVGAASNYAADGVYAAFSHQGFFLVRRNGKLFALSAICTHRKCRLKSEKDLSFYCPCHGSKFDAEGHAKTGPAKRDLPAYATLVDENGQLLVRIPPGAEV